MNFRCLGDNPDPERYYLQQNYSNPEDEISHLKRLLHERTVQYNKLHLVNDKLRRKNKELKKGKQSISRELEERADRLSMIEEEHERELLNLGNQTRCKIKELHNENQHVQECYNKLKQKQNTNEHTMSLLRDEINRLKNSVLRKDDTIKALLPYRDKNKLLLIKLDEMNKMYKKNDIHYRRRISLLKNDSSLKLSQIESLQNDLSNAQQDLLDLTNIVDIKQKLPTIQETLFMFNNIRDQTYTETVGILKEYIFIKEHDDDNNNDNKINNKWYINQICHEIMFNLLMESFNAIKKYKKSIFVNLAEILNMKYNDNDNDDGGKYDDLLTKMLSNYFRMNYENVLKIDDVIVNVMDILQNKENGYYHKDIIMNILNLKSNTKQMIQIYKFINKCCIICWIMILQKEINLKFYPSVWRVKKIQNNQYNDNIHKRVRGSDLKCKQILYYVWPLIISDNNHIIGNQKMEILTRDTFFKPDKMEDNVQNT